MFIPLFAFLYFLVAFAAFSIGNDEAGLKFYPYYTDARIRQMEQETSPEKAEVLAGEVLKLAPCTSKAYTKPEAPTASHRKAVSCPFPIVASMTVSPG